MDFICNLRQSIGGFNMQDVLINGQKIQLPFIYERSFGGTKYLVSYDTMNELERDEKKFILIELNDGFIYEMSKSELQECLRDEKSKISKAILV